MVRSQDYVVRIQGWLLMGQMFGIYSCRVVRVLDARLVKNVICNEAFFSTSCTVFHSGMVLYRIWLLNHTIGPRCLCWRVVLINLRCFAVLVIIWTFKQINEMRSIIMMLWIISRLVNGLTIAKSIHINSILFYHSMLILRVLMFRINLVAINIIRCTTPSWRLDFRRVGRS